MIQTGNSYDPAKIWQELITIEQKLKMKRCKDVWGVYNCPNTEFIRFGKIAICNSEKLPYRCVAFIPEKE